MRATWPAFLPLLEEEALADANVPYLAWLGGGGRPAAGRSRLAARAVRAPAGADGGPRRALRLARRCRSRGTSALGRASRTQDAAARARGRSSTTRRCSRAGTSRSTRSSSAPPPARCGGSRAARASGSATWCARRPRRGTASSTRSPTPTRRRSSRRGRGGASSSSSSASGPERRLPLRAAYGGFVVKNGVPIGYIEGLAFFERLEIGFNMYYTFREGESAWIYAQVLKLHRDALGVTSFSIDPYQLGFENDEAIESGAFWFYRKLGFRPTDAGVRRLLDARGGADRRATRATAPRAATLRAAGHAQPPLRGPGRRAATGTASTSVTSASRSTAAWRGIRRGRRAAARGGREARGARCSASRRGARRPRETGGLRELAPVLDSIPDLSRWSARRARGRRRRSCAPRPRGDESRYLRLLAAAPTAARRADPRSGRPRRQRPLRAATICAMTASAISSGERPPRSGRSARAGARARPRVMPAARRRARRFSWVRGCRARRRRRRGLAAPRGAPDRRASGRA